MRDSGFHFCTKVFSIDKLTQLWKMDEHGPFSSVIYLAKMVIFHGYVSLSMVFLGRPQPGVGFLVRFVPPLLGDPK